MPLQQEHFKASERIQHLSERLDIKFDSLGDRIDSLESKMDDGVNDHLTRSHACLVFETIFINRESTLFPLHQPNNIFQTIFSNHGFVFQFRETRKPGATWILQINPIGKDSRCTIVIFDGKI